jgi:sugar/nucleoside kinase (ribokinase family)
MPLDVTNSLEPDNCMKVFVAGGVSWDSIVLLDRFPEARPHTVFGRRFHETVGSTGAGKALNFAKLGLATTLHAFIGADSSGERVSQHLKRAGVDIVFDIDPAGTPRHINLMNDDGDRISIFVEPGTFDPAYDTSRLEPLMRDADVVTLNIINSTRRLIPVAQRLHKPIWTDLHDWDGHNTYHLDFADAADFIFLSSDSVDDYRALMKWLMKDGKQLVVCTHGQHGSTALTPNGRWIDMPAIDAYPRVDSNGAGDAFFSGFVFAWTQGEPTERCLQIATVVAGMCVTSLELAHSDLTPELVAREESCTTAHQLFRDIAQEQIKQLGSAGSRPLESLTEILGRRGHTILPNLISIERQVCRSCIPIQTGLLIRRHHIQPTKV